ncbi:OLC1v1000787C1 [Oldenlandia corymbosa var. corymbosa]|uniref:OLC1v1000787C1 n=1 Tax=Oldenlandia corymbosa var. corymbosa TaxID=529605 RepID=A0AAV1D3K8_OLDCO|nr:OLC1v1000787C1 [Oldenlandia corymbosa var. corymbosa]
MPQSTRLSFLGVTLTRVDEDPTIHPSFAQAVPGSGLRSHRRRRDRGRRNRESYSAALLRLPLAIIAKICREHPAWQPVPKPMENGPFTDKMETADFEVVTNGADKNLPGVMAEGGECSDHKLEAVSDRGPISLRSSWYLIAHVMSSPFCLQPPVAINFIRQS